ncbi:MAG: arsenate reductase ArsC [Bacteroidia bacterium]
MKRILVLCTGNSCRSQMAQGYLQHFAGNKAEVLSAGIETHGVNPKTIKVMKEDGIDISHHTSNNVSEYKNIDFDFVITVCDNANELCPVFISSNPKTKKLHHNFPDPAKVKGSEEDILNEFRKVRDEIKGFCRDFIDLMN